MAGNSTDPGRSVTSKVTAILMAFVDGGVHTLTEIADVANLPTSTAHRLASELVAWRLLERTEERSYRIGLPLRMIAGEYSKSEICSTTLTVMRALPVLDELSRATRNKVRLGILRGPDVLTLQPPHNRITGRLHPEALQHGVVPAHAAAAGKALLAFSPPAIVDHVIAAGLPAFTPHTITSPDVLRQRLSVIRLTQVATVAERIRVRQSGDRDARLLRRGPRRGRHRTHRRGPVQRIQTGRQRAVRCVPQPLAPTRHRVTRHEQPPWPHAPTAQRPRSNPHR